MEQEQPKKWYDNKITVTVLCIVFFPVGLYALWKNQRIGKGWKYGVTAFFVLLLITKIRHRNDTPTPHSQNATVTHTEEKKAEVTMVSANEISSEYEANEVRADQKYKGKTIQVYGTVKEIKKDIMDNIYVLLQAGDRYSFRNVQCYLDDANAASNLSQGQRILVEGECDGLMMNVQMKDCKLLRAE